MSTKYVIISPSQQGYWNDQLGWVFSVNDATKFDRPVHPVAMPIIGVDDCSCVTLTTAMPMFHPDGDPA